MMWILYTHLKNWRCGGEKALNFFKVKKKKLVFFTNTFEVRWILG